MFHCTGMHSLMKFNKSMVNNSILYVMTHDIVESQLYKDTLCHIQFYSLLFFENTIFFIFHIATFVEFWNQGLKPHLAFKSC